MATLRQFRPLRAGIGAIDRFAPQLLPGVQKRFWRRTYDFWGKRGYGFHAEGETAAATFMNYGYAPLDAGPEAGAERPFGARLYDRVAGDGDFSGRDVLEVGSGRGSGTAHVFATRAPRTMVGLDLADASVAQATADHAKPGLSFRQGDAEQLPFPDASFDTVLNVESSHCYPNVPAFLAEVHRVLKPGGELRLADIRYAKRLEEGGFVRIGHIDDFRDQIRASGFEVVEEEDISANVIKALELDTPRRRELAERAPRFLRQWALQFAGVEGSALHRDYQDGSLRYLRFVLRKPETAVG
jgi:SAM-dependent methyltransferase